MRLGSAITCPRQACDARWARRRLVLASNAASLVLLAALVPLQAISGEAILSAQPISLQRLSASMELPIAGRASTVQVVRTPMEPAAALALAQSEWTRVGALTRQDRLGPWRTVSRVEAGRIEALQLRASGDGGSEGYLVTWRLDPLAGAASAASPAAPHPGQTLAQRLLPSSAVALSHVPASGTQPGRGSMAAGTLVAWAPLRLEAIDAELVARATALGLKPRTEGRDADPDPRRERSRFYSLRGAELAVTLHSQGSGTALVIHLMESAR